MKKATTTRKYVNQTEQRCVASGVNKLLFSLSFLIWPPCICCYAFAGFVHRCVECILRYTVKTISIDITIECLAVTDSNRNEHTYIVAAPTKTVKFLRQNVLTIQAKQRWLGGRKFPKQQKRPQQIVDCVCILQCLK